MATATKTIVKLPKVSVHLSNECEGGGSGKSLGRMNIYEVAFHVDIAQVVLHNLSTV